MAWRPGVKVGALLAVATALLELDRLPTLEAAYPTSIPLSTFGLGVSIAFVIGALLAGLGGWVLVTLATSLYPDGWRIFQGSARCIWRRDAAVAVTVSLAVAAGLSRLSTLVANHFHAFAPVAIDLPTAFDSFWPGAAFLIRGLIFAVLYAAAAAVVIRLVRPALANRAWWIWPGAVLLPISLGPSRAHSVPEFLAGWGLGLVELVVTLSIIAVFFRDNLLAYITATFCLLVADPLVSLLRQSLAFFRWNGILLALPVFIVLVWCLFVGREQTAVATVSPRGDPYN